MRPIAILIMLLLATMFIGIGSYITPPEPQAAQNTQRTNKVWSVWLSLKACGVTFDEVWLSKNDAPRQRVDHDQPIILQWSVDVLDVLVYQLGDLLLDMAQDIYKLEAIGKSDISGKPFTKTFWLSPLGSSESEISRPDRRTNFDVNMSPLQTKRINDWLLSQHQWFITGGETKFRLLASGYDQKAEATMWVKASDCDLPLPRFQPIK